MKLPVSITAVTIAVLGRSIVTTANGLTIGDGHDLIQGTVELVTEGLTDTLNPNLATSENTQQTSVGDGYFAPFSTEEPSTRLFLRNGSLVELAPMRNVAKEAVHQPVPTNKWWGNLIHVTAANTSEIQPAWAQPYAVRLPLLPPFGLQVCFPYTHREIAPEVNGTVKFYLHGIHNDLVLSALEFGDTKPEYEIYSWDDVGIKLRICDNSTERCMDSALSSGMAFVSAKYDGLTPRIDTEYNITSLDDSTPGKIIISLNNNQTWVIYASDNSISFRVEQSVAFSVNSTGSSLVADRGYYGMIRVAVLPENVVDTVYDKFAPCVVTGGTVSMDSRTGYSLHWYYEGSTCESEGLLHFALPHQVSSMSGSMTAQTPGAILLHSTTRGIMVGQMSAVWSFEVPEADFEIDFYPCRRPTPWIVKQTNMLRTLEDDIAGNWSLNAGSWYFNGKAYQKYASLCLMAADSSVVGTNKTLLSFCLEKLETLIEPLLNNSMFPSLAYDTVYRGVVSSMIFDTRQVYTDFGNGAYNDHHYHFGYMVTASAMLKYLDPHWPRMQELEAMILILLRDVANPSYEDHHFPRFRHFCWYCGHSYSRGALLSDQGKDEESTSEDINFYYGMTLWGRVTGQKAIEDLGSLMLRLNAQAIRTYFLLTSDNTIHPPEIVRNHVTGIFFDNKVFYSTWFLDKVHAIHCIQMLPVSPINRLARTSIFVEQEWNDILSKDEIVTAVNSNNSWLSVLLVNAATIDPMNALTKLQTATMDDGLSRAWALYNAATRCRDGVKVVLESHLTLQDLVVEVDIAGSVSL